jgi:anti-sigma-K factor RskA
MSARDPGSHVEDAGAYVLGALSEFERQAFARHLMGCSECRDEVERLRVAADALPRSVAPVAPPPALKRSLMEVVEREARPDRRRRFRVRELGASLTRLRPATAWVSAAFVLLAGVALGVALTELASSDGPRTLSARIDGSRAPSGSATLVVPRSGEGGAVLRVHGMPSLPSSGVYQVWLRRRGETVSQSIFTVSREGNGAGAVTDDIHAADAVLVTRERAGGARAPSERPVVRVPL